MRIETIQQRIGTNFKNVFTKSFVLGNNYMSKFQAKTSAKKLENLISFLLRDKNTSMFPYFLITPKNSLTSSRGYFKTNGQAGPLNMAL